MSIALTALETVGDKALGEWREWTGKAYHVRRRLTAGEQDMIGPVVDVRGTDEAMNRINAIRIAAPYVPLEFLMAER